MSDEDLVTELVNYKCGDCGSDSWTLRIGHRSDGRTFLIVSCANQVCVERKRLALDAEPDALIVWDEFDITSSYNKTEEDEMPAEVN